MEGETIFQHWIVTQFILPFLLIFTITFAILQKTKVLGDGKKQVDAIVAFVIGLIFVSVIFPKIVVANLILFLTVALIVVFVVLLLWGFISGGSMEKDMFTGKAKWVVFGVVVAAVIIALIFAMGIESGLFGFLFYNSWSSDFWINFFFVAVVVVAIALVLRSK